MTRLIVYGSLFCHAVAACWTIPGTTASGGMAAWWLPGMATAVPIIVGIVKLLVPGVAEEPPEVLNLDWLSSGRRL